MFNRRTLFVIGAGASAEANLPIGSDLALEISKKLDIRFDHWGRKHVGSGDIDLFNQLRAKHSDSDREVQEACWLIRDGIHLANSIDDFIDLHRENSLLTLVGKAAVAKCILEAEQNSNLHYDWRKAQEGIDFPKLHSTWFVKFIKMVARSVPVDKCADLFKNISFVVFNYDRCLEHFLLHALQRQYGISEQDASQICQDITIFHPYGIMGNLVSGNSMNGIRFGELDGTDYRKLANNIRTYTEQVEEGDELANIRSLVEDANCLIFLGFAFHEQNMRILTPEKQMKPKPVYATAFGMSDSDADVSIQQISAMFQGAERRTIRLHNTFKSADLFDNYSKSLAG